MDEAENPEDKILALAKKRFTRCIESVQRSRVKAKDDIRFAAASPDDPWQWTDADRKLRTDTQRPCLTINKMPQHIRQVTNDIRQNRPSIRFRPADDKADPEVADILMGVMRHIESNSDADIAYDTAAEHQITHGEGFVRVVADYIRDDSFDQDIFIKRCKHPFRYHLDPDIEDPVGADSMFGFVEETLTEEEFKAQYPDAVPINWDSADRDAADGWFTGDKTIRLVEYFYIEDKPDTLYLYEDGTTGWKSDKATKSVKSRKAQKRTVLWCKLHGQGILEGPKKFPGKYVPLVRIVGNEWIVEGETITSGIVRNAKDSQRMYNVAQSAVVERIMQAPKSPWVAPADAIEGYEQVWQTANTANHSFLPFNHQDDAGNPIPMPQRVQPATVETGLNQIVMGASDDIKAETGQYDASLGQKSNETSGKAILARQREGDTSTFHYIDNLARGVRHVGRICLSMLPEVYDTARVARVVGEDGNESQSAHLDPEQQQPLVEMQDEKGDIQRIFNPFLGSYDVVATTGPSFTTRRVEAAQAMTELTQANPALWGVIGDKLVAAMDWPGAEEMQERLKLTLIPPVQQMLSAKSGKAMPPEAMAQIQQLTDAKNQLEHALQQAAQEHQQLEDQVKAGAQVKQQQTQGQIAIEQAKAQTTMQIAAFQAHQAQQAEAQKQQREMVAEQAKAQREAQFEHSKLQNEVAGKALDHAHEDRMQRLEGQLTLLLQRMKDETTLEVAEMSAATTLQNAQITAAQSADSA